MGRKGSRLIPFLKNALFYEKYSNLKYEHVPSQAFSLNLPQKSSRLEEKCQYILKDWYRITGRNYIFNEDYTKGKQGMESALRRSDFLLLIQSGRKKELIYRILSDEEVRAKKLSKKALNKKQKRDQDPPEAVDNVPSPESSGYGSGSDVADEGFDHALLHAFKHDHKYEYTNDCIQEPENVKHENYPSLQIEDLFNIDSLSFEQWNAIDPGPQIKNPTLNDLNFNLGNEPMKEMDNLENLEPMDGIDSDKFFTDKEFDELCKLIDELPPVLDEPPVNNVISTQNVVDVVSYKTQICKVYECRFRQEFGGMILLTCEPKFKEFCVSPENIDEPSSSKLVFDEETLMLMSSCLLEGMQILPNDHILVFLKYKELVNHLSSPITECLNEYSI